LDEVNADGFSTYGFCWDNYVKKDAIPNEEERPNDRQLELEEIGKNSP